MNKKHLKNMADKQRDETNMYQLKNNAGLWWVIFKVKFSNISSSNFSFKIKKKEYVE